MTSYSCDICKFKTTLKSNYTNHLETTKHIRNSKSKVSPMVSPSKSHECKYCGKKYAHKQSVTKHIKYSCHKNKDEDLKELVRLLNLQQRNMETQMNNQNKKIEHQTKLIEKLTSKLEIHDSFNNSNIQNNITLLAYKDTDVSHLTKLDFESSIRLTNYCVKSLIEKIHFNPLKPENMNIRISNLKDKYLMIYDGTNWNTLHKEDEIDRIYDHKEIMLEEWLDSNPDPILKAKFIKYLNNKERDECLNRIKEEVKMMIYNKTGQLCIES